MGACPVRSRPRHCHGLRSCKCWLSACPVSVSRPCWFPRIACPCPGICRPIMVPSFRSTARPHLMSYLSGPGLRLPLHCHAMSCLFRAFACRSRYWRIITCSFSGCIVIVLFALALPAFVFAWQSLSLRCVWFNAPWSHFLALPIILCHWVVMCPWLLSCPGLVLSWSWYCHCLVLSVARACPVIACA